MDRDLAALSGAKISGAEVLMSELGLHFGERTSLTISAVDWRIAHDGKLAAHGESSHARLVRATDALVGQTVERASAGDDLALDIRLSGGWQITTHPAPARAQFLLGENQWWLDESDGSFLFATGAGSIATPATAWPEVDFLSFRSATDANFLSRAVAAMGAAFAAEVTADGRRFSRGISVWMADAAQHEYIVLAAPQAPGKSEIDRFVRDLANRRFYSGDERVILVVGASAPKTSRALSAHPEIEAFILGPDGVLLPFDAK
jgi:hypothetical protein